jgi:hypothetical protein
MTGGRQRHERWRKAMGELSLASDLQLGPPLRFGGKQMAEKWIPSLYQYGVGGLFFVATLWLAARSEALRLNNHRDRWLFIALIGGFLGFLAVHGLWILTVH